MLRHGLLRASYIPNREQRELQEVARYRKNLIEERAREINRLQKMLEGANIKLDSVVSDVTGQSARRLLDSIIAGKRLSSEDVASMINKRMLPKLPELMKSLDGIMSSLQRRLPGQVVDHIDDMTRRISDLDKLVGEHMQKYEAAISSLDELPGIARRSAEVILAEIGLDMLRFPAQHICARGQAFVPAITKAQASKNPVEQQKGIKLSKPFLRSAPRLPKM